MRKIFCKPKKKCKLVNLWNPIKIQWNVSIFQIFNNWLFIYFIFPYFLWIYIVPWLFWSTAMIRFTSLYSFIGLQMKPTIYIYIYIERGSYENANYLWECENGRSCTKSHVIYTNGKNGTRTTFSRL